jgi:hypothetical protein
MKIKATQADYDYFLRALVSGAYDGTIKQSHYGEFTPTVMVLTIVILWITKFLTRNMPLPVHMLSLIAGFALGWLVMYVCQKIREKTYRRKVYPAEDDPCFLEYTYHFTPGALVAESEKSSTRFEPAAFKKLYEDEHMLILFRSNMQGLLFPKAQMSQDEINQVTAWCQTYLDN